MLLILIVSLYTSRVVLKTLGAVDYGLYNVIGGVVTIFSFINATLALSTERFISILIGKKVQEKEIQKNFSTILIIHFLIALLVIIICETIGLYFVKNILEIPDNRIKASMIVYQISVISIFFSFMIVPYNGLIIAHEKMEIFAYFSIIDTLLKLIVIYFLSFLGYDKLILYSILILIIGIISFLIYFIYSYKEFKESRFVWSYDRELYKNILSFSGWNIFSTLSSSLSNQGINIIMNLFFGPIINAARGIAFQVNGAIGGFTSNIQVAVNPQIFKLWGQNEIEEFKNLIYNSSKFSFLLISVILCPIILEINYILKIWLVNPPHNTAIFCRLIFIQIIIFSISRSFVTGVNAIGKIKTLNLISGFALLSVLPISYLLYYLGYPAYTTFIVYGISLLIEFLIAFYILSNTIKLLISGFLSSVILPIIKVLALSLPLPIIFHFMMDDGIIRFLLIGICDVILFLIGTFMFAIDNQTKKLVIQKIINFVYGK